MATDTATLIISVALLFLFFKCTPATKTPANRGGRTPGFGACKGAVDLVQNMFPRFPRTVIEADLARTGSVETTCENILSGVLVPLTPARTALQGRSKGGASYQRNPVHHPQKRKQVVAVGGGQDGKEEPNELDALAIAVGVHRGRNATLGAIAVEGEGALVPSLGLLPFELHARHRIPIAAVMHSARGFWLRNRIISSLHIWLPVITAFGCRRLVRSGGGAARLRETWGADWSCHAQPRRRSHHGDIDEAQGSANRTIVVSGSGRGSFTQRAPARQRDRHRASPPPTSGAGRIRDYERIKKCNRGSAPFGIKQRGTPQRAQRATRLLGENPAEDLGVHEQAREEERPVVAP
ncbi:hypothetical protein BDK51DRAFT_28138 [Blyttiomyces helicus]|uniref:CUE domain-containing protein n=1 Tax=Blyttiomyces helicus TaxID=388810 RepID=A0A4P9WDJ5_9FUNG|nr:hypothetical protein BDK51DRAFT_28138 [Blyttiomyces helicus]|eukprot:RKO89795.1 hypothetical protein BDK51DRAFT_28138 [Blyttiomyces helicus]